MELMEVNMLKSYYTLITLIEKLIILGELTLKAFL